MERKDLVLGTMKSSILDGGTISLNMFLKSPKALPTGIVDGSYV